MKVWRSSKFPQAATCLVLHGAATQLFQSPSPFPCTEVMLYERRASEALAKASPPGEPRTCDATSKRSGVPLTTLYYRDYRRRSKEEKAQGQ